MYFNGFANQYTGLWSVQETLNFISKQDTKTVQKKIKIEKKLNESKLIITVLNKENSRILTINKNAQSGIFNQTVNNSFDSLHGLFYLQDDKTLKLYCRYGNIDKEEIIKLISPTFYVSYIILKHNNNLIGIGFKSAIKIAEK